MKGAFYSYYRDLLFPGEKEKVDLAYRLLVNSGKKVTIAQFSRAMKKRIGQKTSRFSSRHLWKMMALVNSCPEEDYIIKVSRGRSGSPTVFFWAEPKKSGGGARENK